MSEPVLVIHGVANRDKSQFETLVSDTLQRKVGADFQLIPVYWGDLGAKTADISDTLPDTGSSRAMAPMRVSAKALARPGRQRATRLSIADRAAIVAAGATPAVRAGRARRTAVEEDALAVTIRQLLPATTYLKTTDNEELLASAGRLVALAIEQSTPTRSAAGGRRAGLNLKGLVRGVLNEADEFLGLAIGEGLGRVNHFLRDEFIPNVTEFLGDIFVYEHHRKELQARIWEEIARHPRARGRGTAAKPINVVAHSLGGVIAFQAATAGDGTRTLSIKGLVTFGSQSPYFHVLDPAASGLPSYRRGHPVPISSNSIRKWTNLWEPLDPLAFVAGRVFQLQSASPIQDRETRHKASSGLWTHSTYWASSDLIKAIRETCS